MQYAPGELFNQNRKYIILDATSICANVPLNRIAKLILKRIYNNNLIPVSYYKPVSSQIPNLHLPAQS